MANVFTRVMGSILALLFSLLGATTAPGVGLLGVAATVVIVALKAIVHEVSNYHG